MTPQTLLIDPASLATYRERAQRNDPAPAPAIAALRKQANEALTRGPYSVTYRTKLAPSGDKHDYVSMGTYWWPDPAKPDGLPWIRRDGVKNPAIDAYDVKPLEDLCYQSETLALAWTVFGEKRYAEHAAKLLRTWYLDPATRMNPHLRYSQFIPGRCDGRCIGLIDTVKAVPVWTDVLPMLQTSDAWSSADQRGMVDWCGQYLNWLLTDPLGIEERGQHNNHGTGLDLQLVALSLVCGDEATAKSVLAEVPARRIDQHIQPDGSQPHELKRTLSFGYSVYNLSMLVQLALMGRHAGVDLWIHRTPGGSGIAEAIDYVAATLLQPGGWPFQQLNPMNYGLLIQLLLAADKAEVSNARQPVIERIADLGDLSKAPRIDGLIQPGAR